MGKGGGDVVAQQALHTVGSRVWVWQGDWLRGEVVSVHGPRLKVRLEGGDERECTAGDIPLQNSSASGVEVRRGGWACRPAVAGGGPAGGSEQCNARVALGLLPLCAHAEVCTLMHPSGQRGGGAPERAHHETAPARPLGQLCGAAGA